MSGVHKRREETNAPNNLPDVAMHLDNKDFGVIILWKLFFGKHGLDATQSGFSNCTVLERANCVREVSAQGLSNFLIFTLECELGIHSTGLGYLVNQHRLSTMFQTIDCNHDCLEYFQSVWKVNPNMSDARSSLQCQYCRQIGLLDYHLDRAHLTGSRSLGRLRDLCNAL